MTDRPRIGRPDVIVPDTGPLIRLARADALRLLHLVVARAFLELAERRGGMDAREVWRRIVQAAPAADPDVTASAARRGLAAAPDRCSPLSYTPAICHTLPMSSDPLPPPLRQDDRGPADPDNRTPQLSQLNLARLAPDADDARFLRRLVLALVVGGVAVALWHAGDLLILAFGSVLGAIVIHAVADLWRDRLRVPQRAALALGILCVLAAVGFLLWLFGVAFRQQLNVLVVRLPGLLDQLAGWAGQSPVGAKVVDAVRAAYAGSRVAQDIGGLAEGVGRGLVDFVLVLVGAIFFAAAPATYERGLLLLVPPTRRPAAEDALFDVGQTLRLWLRAQLIQMTSMGLMTGVGLWAAGVPSAPALALLTGLSEFVPYVGPLAAMLPALGLAATAGTRPLLGALTTFALVRLVQTNLVTPFVTARVIAVPPAVTLFSVVAVGLVFGVFGLFFSAALLVVIFQLVRSVYLREVLGEPVPRAEHRTLLEPRKASSR